MKLLLLLPSILLLASCASRNPPASALHGTAPGSLLRQGNIVLDLKTDKVSYRDGDPVTITLTASRRCSIKVFNEDAAGNRTQLWPGAFSSSAGIVAAGEPLLIPAKGASFTLKAGPPYGINTLIAVASSAPFRSSGGVDDFFVDKGGMQAFARKGISWSPSSVTASLSAQAGEARLLYEVKAP